MLKFLLLSTLTLLVVSSLAVTGGKLEDACVLQNKSSNWTEGLKTERFNVSGGCTVAEFKAHLDLGNDKVIVLADGTVNKNSSCFSNSSNLAVLQVDYNCTQLHINLSRNSSSKTISIRSIDGFYNLNTSKIPISLEPNENFPEDSYYKCTASQSFRLSSSLNANLTISDFKIEVSRNPDQPPFYKQMQQCQLDSKQAEGDWVRIAVFICLVASVVIVLVAYFVGRRRWSERSSYESV